MKYFYRLVIKTFIFFILFINASVAFAQPGFLDPTFGNGGKVETQFSGTSVYLFSCAIQPDGKIIAAGITNYKYTLTRYNYNGDLDTSFGVNGKSINQIGSNADPFCYTVATLPGNKILAGGTASFSGYYNATLVRYNSNGRIDSSFGNNGIVDYNLGNGYSAIHKIIVKPDGKILALVAGYFFLSSPYFSLGLIQLKADGTFDSSFAANGLSELVPSTAYNEINAQAMALLPNGKIIVGGIMQPPGTNQYYNCALFGFSQNGIPDSTFGVNGIVNTDFSGKDDVGQALCIQDDGKIILTGYEHDSTQQNLCLLRYNAYGTLDSSFGSQGKVKTSAGISGYGVYVLPGGKILVIGTVVAGDYALLRYTSSGLLDSTYGLNGIVTTDFFGHTDIAYASAIEDNTNKIVVVGFCTDSIGQGFGVARYQGFTLPLKLLTFTAKKENNTNLLQWTTAQEVNVDHFEIQRAAPLTPQRGELEAPYNSPGGGELKFVSIGVIPSKAKAGSTGILSYNYTDVAPPFGGRGGLFYRLRMIDRDGKFTYSPIRIINNSSSFSVSIYPNPAKDKLQVIIDSDKKKPLQLQVLSLDGKVLLSNSFTANEGLTSRSINITTLPKGIYYLKVATQNPPLEGREAKFEKL